MISRPGIKARRLTSPCTSRSSLISCIPIRTARLYSFGYGVEVTNNGDKPVYLYARRWWVIDGGKGRRGRLVRGSARRNEALPVAAAVAVGADWSFIDAARDPIEKWPRFAEVALQEGQRLRFEIVPRFNSEPVHFRSGRRADAMEFFDRQRLDKGMAHLGA
jgi:ApaG domain